MGGLTLYADMMSQPSRAVIIFCRVNGIPFTQQTVQIGRGEHKAAAFTAKFPLAKLPAMDDSGFLLSESHAILRYLSTTWHCADHWYPAEARSRARVDQLLDWHHTNLRKGSATLLFQTWLAPLRGLPQSADIAEDARTLLRNSIATLENVWLADAHTGSRGFLLGAEKPSIADLSMACEVVQLKMLGSGAFDDLLRGAPKVYQWLSQVQETCDPSFTDSLKVMNVVLAKREQQQQKGEFKDSGKKDFANNSFQEGAKMGTLYAPVKSQSIVSRI